jgi:hypothetical protein
LALYSHPLPSTAFFPPMKRGVPSMATENDHAMQPLIQVDQNDAAAPAEHCEPSMLRMVVPYDVWRACAIDRSYSSLACHAVQYAEGLAWHAVFADKLKVSIPIQSLVFLFISAAFVLYLWFLFLRVNLFVRFLASTTAFLSSPLPSRKPASYSAPCMCP